MKSCQVFVWIALFVGTILLTVNSVLPDGEEASVAGTEASPEATVRRYVTAQYEEITNTRTGKCIRIYDTDKLQAKQEEHVCIHYCRIFSPSSRCRENCTAATLPPEEHSCRSNWILIVIAVIMLGLVVIPMAALCIFCEYIVNSVYGQPFKKVGQPAAGPPAYANQPDPPANANQPPTGPPAYADQPDPPANANQPPTGPPAYADQPGPPAYANQPPTGPPAYADQPGPPAYANQPPTGPPAYAIVSFDLQERSPLQPTPSAASFPNACTIVQEI